MRFFAIAAGVLGAGLTIAFVFIRGARGPGRDGTLPRAADVPV